LALYDSGGVESFSRFNTLQRRLSALSQLHQEAGPVAHPNLGRPTVFSGLRRELGTAPERKRPLRTEDLPEILLDLPNTRLGKRDRALLLLGFTGAFRRSELVVLDVTDLEETRDGLVVTIRKSKTTKKGREDGRAFLRAPSKGSCPLWALETWRAAAGIETGRCFG